MRRDEKKKLLKNRPDSPGLLGVERRQKKTVETGGVSKGRTL